MFYLYVSYCFRLKLFWEVIMPDEWRAHVDALYVAVVLDALDGLGFRNQSPRVAMPPQTVCRPVIGTAKPLLWVDFAYDDPQTYEPELRAIDSIRHGEIVVCATGESSRSGIWGELLTTAAQQNGAVGVVTDGAVRDTARMTDMDFPVYAAGRSPYDSYNRQKVVDFDVSVEIGGVAIRFGDVIVADGDGVAVVPRDIANEALQAALHKVENETEFRRAVKGGMPLVDAYEKYEVL